MAEDDKLIANSPVESAPPETSANEQDAEQEMGDFITRQVLEKDSVFFEG
jgi:hypothetical protein